MTNPGRPLRWGLASSLLLGGAACHTGKPAQAPPDASPAFVRDTHDRTAQHVFQHADITRAAGRQFFGARLPRVFDLIVFGAQQPDLYNMEDSRFHALYHRATVVGHLTTLF